MVWKTKRGKWDWRRFLTAEEASLIRAADRGGAKKQRRDPSGR